ncbi:MAG: Hsp20/alpha crystallin family protein [Candidatus Portnoybacteria bacterium]|nr:Hsp20/alpha crystallin family protein [Candidatus Portnoybacteria bacterium]
MMKLQPWRSFRDIERFFEDEDWGVMVPSRFFASTAVDIYEKDGNLVAEADIAGVKPEDIEVSIEDNVLTIQGESREEEEAKQKKYYKKERRYGKIYRSVHLPKMVRGSEIAAEFKDGKLTVTMPLSEEAKPKKVKVEVKK